MHIRLHVLLLVVTASCCVVGCAPEPPPKESRATDARISVGGDSDAHGCKASAGYTWCEREGACVRPWELAKQKGFDLDDAGLSRYCSANQP